ncbi:GntR family transcriptional regulator [Parablautia muri]|uniref:GntR family transcriptional regulator n=1 Tax=Parablautia muri TaxID=2320879 RepID=A0A9X5BCL4_9FIRM|nr:GntR family transcriptional regulator [Parablautia muri]NBJ91138.1 GntR family transcriptional regulator [Parablautia muri]
MEKAREARYRTIYKQLKEKIESGEYKQGNRIKTEKELQEEYGVSRDTIRRALSHLENEDYIVKRPALGTFVKHKKSDYQLSKMESFTEQMKSRGIAPSSEIISIELVSNPERQVVRELLLGEEEKCYRITRIRKGDESPMAYEIAYIPQKLCPNLQKYLDDTSSLYQIYEEVYHLRMGDGRIRLEADMPGIEIQKSLGIAHDAPVLRMECTTLLEDETPLYYVECYYIGAKYYFSTVLPRK